MSFETENAELAEIYAGFNAGFALGEGRITPGDALSVLIVFAFVLLGIPISLSLLVASAIFAWPLFGDAVANQLYGGITQTASGVAHFAHLGGMLFGLLLITAGCIILPMRSLKDSNSWCTRK